MSGTNTDIIGARDLKPRLSATVDKNMVHSVEEKIIYLALINLTEAAITLNSGRSAVHINNAIKEIKTAESRLFGIIELLQEKVQ